MIEFNVYCKAEKKDIGILALPNKTTVNPKNFLDGFTPKEPAYSLTDEAIKDGTQVLCPKCKNPLLIREEGGKAGVYLVPGAIETA